MHFFTIPSMAKEASLRISKTEVELLNEREHLHMIEPANRGRVTSVCETRRLTKIARRNLVLVCVDANNRYTGVMQLEKLPIADFWFKRD